MKAILNNAVLLRFITAEAFHTLQLYSCVYKGEFAIELSEIKTVKEANIFAENWCDKNLILRKTVKHTYYKCGGGDFENIDKHQYRKIETAIKKAYISEILSIWKLIRLSQAEGSKIRVKLIRPV
jgi:hypothetical protein